MFVFPKNYSDRSDQNWPNTKFFHFFFVEMKIQFLVNIWLATVLVIEKRIFTFYTYICFWKVDLLKLMMSELKWPGFNDHDCKMFFAGSFSKSIKTIICFRRDDKLWKYWIWHRNTSFESFYDFLTIRLFTSIYIYTTCYIPKNHKCPKIVIKSM